MVITPGSSTYPGSAVYPGMTPGGGGGGTVICPGSSVFPGHSIYPGMTVGSEGAAFAIAVMASLVSRVMFNTSFASTCIVGAPYQANMRQLAADRWNYMYPS